MSVYKKGVSRIAVALASLAMGASSAQAETGQIGYPESWRTPEFLSDWGLGAMKADHAYAQGITGKGVKIGIVDSGVLLNHPDLLGQVTGVTDSGAYFANGFRYGPTNGAYRQGEPYSIPGGFMPGINDTHGTHVGGSMVASRNGVGMHGVAFGSTLYSSNTGGMDSFISGANADYNLFKGAYGNLVAAGARVINTSWGNAPRYERTTDLAGLTQAYLPMALRRTFMDALEEVSRTGVVLVFAAGNSNLQPDPANHATPYAALPFFRPELESGWLAAAALGQDGKLTSFSNRCGIAKWWCVATPGQRINSTSSSGGYVLEDGTSMAAPHATGAVALLLQRFPYMTGSQALQTLFTTADKLGGDLPTEVPNAESGWGKVNLQRAMRGPGQLFGHLAPNLGAGVQDTFSNDISDAAIRARKADDQAQLQNIRTMDLQAQYAATLRNAESELADAEFYTEYARKNEPDKVAASEKDAATLRGEIERLKQERDLLLAQPGAFITELLARKSAAIARMGLDPLTGQTYVGSLEKRGDGKLTLAGRNTYTGSTWVRGGDLELTGSLVSETTVDASGVGMSFINPTTRSEEVTTRGGRFIVAPGGKAAGIKVRDGGAAIVNGEAGAVVAEAGGLVSGSGQLGSLQALAGSGIAPGNSIGTLSVSGPVSFATGATYFVEVARDGRSDRIDAAGAATLAGGTVFVSPENLRRPLSFPEARSILGQRFTILNASGGVSGRFDGVVPNFLFLDASLGYSRTSVTLSMERSSTSFASVGSNRNQSGVGAGIEGLGQGNPLYESILLMTSQQSARSAFQQLSGDIHASTGGNQLAAASTIRGILSGRVPVVAAPSTPGVSGSGSFAASFASYGEDGQDQPATTMSLAQPQRYGAWGQVLGSYGKTRSDGTVGGSDHRLGGMILGADGLLDNGIKLGAAAGFTQTHAQARGGAQQSTTDSPFAAIYGGYDSGPLSLQLGTVYALSTTKARRSVSFPGFTDLLTSEAEGRALQSYGELGYRIALNRSWRQITLRQIEPFIGASYTRLDNDGFRERGGAAALTSFARSANLGDVTLGAKSEIALDLGLETPLSLRSMLGYRHSFGDLGQSALLAFGDGPRFKSAGIPLDRHMLVAETGLDLRLSQNLTLAVSYTAQYGHNSHDHTGKGSLTYRW